MRGVRVVFASLLLPAMPAVVALASGAGCNGRDTIVYEAGVPGTSTVGPGKQADAMIEAGGDAHDSDAELDASGDAHDAEVDSRCLGDDDAGTVDCDAGDAGAMCGDACGRVLARYRGAVGTKAARCVLALASCADGGEGDIPSCVDVAIGRACSVETSTSFCTPLVLACEVDASDAGAIVTPKGCKTFADGLSDAGREELRDCLFGDAGGSTCTATPIGCFDSIRQ